MSSNSFIRFSPDGRWVATGDADGVIKIWDLQAGKLMKELTGHSSAVNTLEFHPSECLLASGSADKTIRFWDVEKFELVSVSEPDAGNVKCILFYPETEGIEIGTLEVGNLEICLSDVRLTTWYRLNPRNLYRRFPRHYGR